MLNAEVKRTRSGLLSMLLNRFFDPGFNFVVGKYLFKFAKPFLKFGDYAIFIVFLSP
jgi:hypothetical protein